MLSEGVQKMLTLRSLTETTGAIHEEQLLQLRYYGAVALAHTSWEARVDQEQRLVDYIVKKKKWPKDFAKYLAVLDRSVHWLLGDDWATRVTEGNRVIYQGKRTSRAKKKIDERRKRIADRKDGGGKT